ncbi:MAG TPA: alpha/beta hydrolase [Hyphomonadaceae bacterium]|nr:alpha/beta hydrolase [Hyphomonadaceae bacterium]
MTLFADFRSKDKRGVVVPVKFCESTAADPDARKPVEARTMRQQAAGKRVLFMCHGFNVNREDGIASAAAMEADLQSAAAPFPISPSTTLFVGVLWPGDWYTVLNYPVEAFDALTTGGYLATAIQETFDLAASISFVSHSLGARVVLSAAGTKGVPRARQIILTAPAADNDTLAREHAAAYDNADAIYVLSSKRDRTLKYLYPAGDAISDVLGDDDSPFGGALGYRGPKPAVIEHVTPFGIPGKPYNQKNKPSLASDYDHCDYFPWPSKRTPKSDTVSHYVSAAFADQGTLWP